jgi:hypothetical protein
MTLFERPRSTRGQFILAGVHISILAIALIVAWQKDGPPHEKAFWAILSYFVEIAIVGVVDVAVNIIRWSRQRDR